MYLKLLNGAGVWLIGDPHIGKNFEVGVPLARRGEREKLQMEQFKAELATDCDYIVIVGDLFDHPYVSYAAVLDTYKALANEAASSPNKNIIVMAGNHDVPRNLEAVGAFHILESMLHLRSDNLIVARFAQQVGPIVLFPWEWNIGAREQIDLAALGGFNPNKVELIVGHWDLKQFGESDDHLVPTRLLRARFPEVPIVSGHYHVAGTYTVDEVEVICTGSMQPYSHGEDPDNEMYLTLTLDELGEHDLKNKCVRVLLREGEELPSNIDCLSLIPKRISDEDESIVPVGLTAFDWKGIMDRKLSDVPDPVREYIQERLPSHV